MKAAVYCRVSTEDQEKEGTSLQTQLDACKKYCQKKGYEVAVHFSETYSGLTLERPKLAELRDLIRDREVNVMVIYCLDRLSRNATHGVILRDELDKNDVFLESVTEDIDKTPLGEAITYLRGTFAQVEAEKIRERTMRGKKAFLQKGQMPTGTGKGIYGYKWDKENKKRIPLEMETRVVERIFESIANHEGYFNTARKLNDLGIPTKTGGKWSPRTIYNMTGNPSYIGMTYYGQTHGSRKTKLVKQPKSEWILLPDVTPPIISRELFDRVQEIRRINGEMNKAKAKHDYVLRGHVVCGYCGTPLVGSFMNHNFRYYHCRATYPTVTRVKACNARYIRADELEEKVFYKLGQVLLHPELVLAAIKDELKAEEKNFIQEFSFEKEIQKLKRQINSYETQEKRVVQLFRYQEIDENAVLDEISNLKKEMESDKLKLDNLIKTQEKIAALKKAEIELVEFCKTLKGQLDTATYQQKRDILDMLAIKVIASNEGAEIEGIIPLEKIPSDINSASVERTHHCTNIGITTCT